MAGGQRRRHQSGLNPPTGNLRIPAYFDDRGNLNPDLVDRGAENWAKALSSVSGTQLRRFYEHVMSLDRELRLHSAQHGGRQKAFERLRAEFLMLRPQVHYARGRQGGQVTEELLQFIDQHVRAVGNDVKKFDAFLKHFQSVIAFHKYFESRKSD